MQVTVSPVMTYADQSSGSGSRPSHRRPSGPPTTSAVAKASASAASGPTTVAETTSRAGWPVRGSMTWKPALVRPRGGDRPVEDLDDLGHEVVLHGVPDTDPPRACRLGGTPRGNVATDVHRDVGQTGSEQGRDGTVSGPALDVPARVEAPRHGPRVEGSVGQLARLAAAGDHLADDLRHRGLVDRAGPQQVDRGVVAEGAEPAVDVVQEGHDLRERLGSARLDVLAARLEADDRAPDVDRARRSLPRRHTRRHTLRITDRPR